MVLLAATRLVQELLHILAVAVVVPVLLVRLVLVVQQMQQQVVLESNFLQPIKIQNKI